MHGDIAYIEKLGEEFARSDAVLFAGDFARFQDVQTGLPALKLLTDKHDSVFAVTGNCDEPAFLEELEKADISVQGGLVFRDGLVFAGSGGALKFTGTTPNERSDEELVSDLRIVREQEPHAEGGVRWPNLIALVHQPPKDTKCDRITAGVHVGSPLIRAFIEEVQPLAVVTGHIHESFGIDSIGDTVVMNPGSLAEGRYGVLEAERTPSGWKIARAELCEIPSD